MANLNEGKDKFDGARFHSIATRSILYGSIEKCVKVSCIAINK